MCHTSDYSYLKQSAHQRWIVFPTEIYWHLHFRNMYGAEQTITILYRLDSNIDFITVVENRLKSYGVPVNHVDALVHGSKMTIRNQTDLMRVVAILPRNMMGNSAPVIEAFIKEKEDGIDSGYVTTESAQ